MQHFPNSPQCRAIIPYNPIYNYMYWGNVKKRKKKKKRQLCIHEKNSLSFISPFLSGNQNIRPKAHQFVSLNKHDSLSYISQKIYRCKPTWETIQRYTYTTQIKAKEQYLYCCYAIYSHNRVFNNKYIS